MAVIFLPDRHQYLSTEEEKIDWVSATKFVEKFKTPFDAVGQSVKNSKNTRSKWYGLDPKFIQDKWKSMGEYSSGTGTEYHADREIDISSFETLNRQGINIPIFAPVYIDNIKHAPIQRLTEGIYPEHFVYLKSAKLCGQADRVEVVKDVVDIIDFKTCREIKRESFKNWEGQYKMMLGPCAHLMDCDFTKFSLQLSTYLYIILKHNPNLKPGKLILHHVKFEVDKLDEFGYPIYRKGLDNKPIVDKVEPIECPYLKSEVRNMINFILENK